jgi:hypothetical protein
MSVTIFHKPGFARAAFARCVADTRRTENKTLFGEHGKDFLHVVAAELLIAAERQLERRALDVIDQDMEVVGVNQGVLR